MLFLISSLPSDWLLLLDEKNHIEPPCYAVIDAPVARRLLSYRQKKLMSKEAGGVLLGFIRGAHLHVVDVTIPMRGDKQKRSEYCRLDPGHSHAIELFHKQTHGKGTYLGEWHTHPEATPSPSSIDKNEWKKIYRQRSIACLPSLFLIVGTNHIFLSYH